MAIKTYRPTTPTRRFQTTVSREEITRKNPEKSLVESKKRSGGRNSVWSERSHYDASSGNGILEYLRA